MKAWLQTGFGGAEVRELTEVPAPRPSEDEVLVRVVACALNRLDILQRAEPVVSTFRLPHIAGMDVAGVVVEAGSGRLSHLRDAPVVIDPVVSCERCDMCVRGLSMYCRKLRTIGSSRDGGLAKFVAVPARNCIPLALDRSDVRELADLASVPVASVTAWHGLLGAGRIEAGETVVIPGAGSGLGATGIQLAKRQGCRVITIVGSPDKVEKARALGADLVIDRSAVDWVEQARELTDGVGADLVWDHVGGRFLQQAIDAARIGGRVVMSGTTEGGLSTIRNTSVFHWGRSLIGHGGYSRAEMADTVAAYRSGALKAVVDSYWAFEDFRAAEARLESGRSFGKVVVYGPGIEA